MSIKIITTEDGSHSLYDDVLNETYHSTRGAVGESRHVFIQEGLGYYTKDKKEASVRVLEIGLGTGLNALLTAQFAAHHQQHVHFHSLEPYPLAKNLYEKLNYGDTAMEQELLQKIHDSNWEALLQLSNYFKLYKSKVKIEDFTVDDLYDLIYFDAFAPSKQPEVWGLHNLQKCYEALKVGGVLTTYCAQGQFKRNLKEAGFKVETLAGAMGKKEMIRAMK